MATYTTQFQLKKPEVTDFVSIQDLNDNADIIEETLAELVNTPTEYDLPLGTGVTAVSGWKNTYTKSPDGLVTVHIGVSGVAHGEEIATLPDGFRPSGQIGVCAAAAGYNTPMSVWVLPSGSIVGYYALSGNGVNSSGTTLQKGDTVYVTFSFYAVEAEEETET